MKGTRAFTLALALTVGLGTAREAGAHALAPSLLELTAADGGRVEVLFKTPTLVPAGGPELRPELPAACRALTPRTSTVEGTAAVIRWSADCGEAGLRGGRIAVSGLAERSTDTLVRRYRQERGRVG